MSEPLMGSTGSRELVVAACGVIFGLSVAVPNAVAQNQDQFLSRTSPTPPYRTPDATQYNLKWGNVTGRLSASVVSEFSDNINLSENHRKADFYIGPEVGIGFLWPISQSNVLQLDIGAGYRWYVNSPSINTFTISPKNNSHLDYYLYIEDVRINIHDSFSIQVDPTDLAQVSGGPTTLLNFRRLLNTAGLVAEWRANKQTTIYAGYDYSIERSLSGQFQQLDVDDHTFSAGVNYAASSRLTVGLGASYTISEYLQQIQNNGRSFTIGPRATYKATQFLTFDASVGYSVSTYDNSGTIGDTSSYRGLTYQVGVSHKINKRMNEDLRFSQGIGIGLGSNFTKTSILQYDISAQLTSAVTVNALAAYEILEGSSSAVEKASQIVFTLGSAFRIAPRWSLGVAYTFALKDSNQPGRDYVQNRVTLDLTRQF